MAEAYRPNRWGLTSEDVEVLAILHKPKKKQEIEEQIEREVRI